MAIPALDIEAYLDAEHLAAELLGEKARRAAGAAAHVQDRCAGADPGAARKDEHFARQQGAFLADEVAAVSQRGR